MKASRITAVGLVAAAALWIASGHFLPHEIGGKPRRRAHRRRRGEEAFPRRRRGDDGGAAQPQAHRCRAAPKPTSGSLLTARTGGMLTELQRSSAARG